MDKNEYGVGLYNEGVFYFTNPGLFKGKTKQINEAGDFTTLWNNKEYIYKAKTTTPMIIQGEPPENIQHIRKQFAKNYATGWFYQTPRYRELVKKGGYIPATFVEDEEFKDVIQACLTPLPKSEAIVKELPRKKDSEYRGSKAIGKNTDLNAAFADYQIPELGQVN